MQRILALLSAIVAVGMAGPAMAGPNLSFNLDRISSATIGSGTLGTVTLTQNGANEVDVVASLMPNAKFVNTGGPHTPFTFNLASNSPAVTVTMSAAMAGLFFPNASGGAATPYGAFNYAIEYTGQNGGGHGNAGPISFSVTRASGISTTDFVGNNRGKFFAADIIGPGAGARTGSIASRGPGTDVPPPPPPPPPVPVPVPEPASLLLLGGGLLALGLARRRRPGGQAT